MGAKEGPDSLRKPQDDRRGLSCLPRAGLRPSKATARTRPLGTDAGVGEHRPRQGRELQPRCQAGS